jgi:hypothetical protein
MVEWRTFSARLREGWRIRRDSQLHLTEYDSLLLDIDHHIPLSYFVSASLLSWLLLAGYLISPSTYASIQQTEVLKDAGKATKSVFRVIRNLPLLVIASVGCFIATAGLAFISYEWWCNRV